MKNLFLFAIASVLFFSCSNSTADKGAAPKKDSPTVIAAKTDSAHAQPSGPIADAATIMKRKQVPILCYHHIRDLQMVSKASKGYEVTVQEFKDQMKILADSGFHTITPEQYYNYLAFGAALPNKPVMLTYDDTDEEQFSIAKPEMDKYGFKGVYFIMTISIGRPHYMTKEQIKQLSDEGHVIASHTWDHHRVDKLKSENTIDYRGKKTVVNEWDFQLTNTKKLLEEMTGKSVEYFAFPFGVWNRAALPEIEKRGYKMAFQLSEKRDSTMPLYTARRMIVSPEWSAPALVRIMGSTFK